MGKRQLKPARARRKVAPKSVECSTEATELRANDNGVQTRSPYNRCALYGAALVAAEVYDPDFCVHGPQGCISAIIEGFTTQGKELEFHHSGMTQHEIIFGGESTLFKSVHDVFSPYERSGPKYVFTSCSPEIIGDNVDAVCARFHDDLPLVKVETSGFGGDQYSGIDNTLTALVEKFATRNPARNPSLVNLIGCIGLNRQWRGDVYELERLLKAFGLEVNRLACDSTIEEMKKSSTAALSVLLIPEAGHKAAQYLKKEFQIPYMQSSLFLPLGLRGTEVWLTEIGEALSISAEKTHQLVQKEEDRVREALQVGISHAVYAEKLSRMRRLPVAIVAEGPVAFSWARFVSEEMDMQPVFIALRTGGDNPALLSALNRWQQESSFCPKILNTPTTEDLRETLRETRAEFILGSSIEYDIASELGIEGFLHIANPNDHFVNITCNPFLGYSGILYAAEAILNTVRQ